MWTPAIWYGGAKGVTLSADYEIKDRRVRVWSVAPSADNWKVKLPDARLLTLGSNVFVVVNEHATRVVLVVNNAGVTVATLTGHQAAKCSLEAQASAAGTWRTRVVGW